MTCRSGNEEYHVTDLLKLAVDAHGGLQRQEQLSRFSAAASITPPGDGWPARHAC